MKVKNIRIRTLLAWGLLPFFSSHAQKIIKPPYLQENWSQDYEPFRIAGNLYYVGTYDLSCYLITTAKGNILINTGLAESVPMIRKHIEKLGFKFSDIKILLTNQAHYDHVGGMATIQKMTGAQMMVEEGDAAILADGGNSDFSFGGNGSLFQPVKVNRVLHDKDTIKLGEIKIVLLHHPGHTKGASSFLFDVRDKQQTYRVLIANMPSILDDTKANMPAYPEVAHDYKYTIDAMKNLTFDIWLAAHAGQFKLHDKHKPGDIYSPNAFKDKVGYDKIMNEFDKAYLERFESR